MGVLVACTTVAFSVRLQLGQRKEWVRWSLVPSVRTELHHSIVMRQLPQTGGSTESGMDGLTRRKFSTACVTAA